VTCGVVVIGSGPAGLMAADVVSSGGRNVVVIDRMPSPGRKLLMAGRGGLNLTHSEPLEAFLARYGARQACLGPMVRDFPPAALVRFVEALGQTTFVGSSGRIFPTAMKASPLLRAWLRRLGERGVSFLTGHRLLDVDSDLTCRFGLRDGREATLAAKAVVLALGGASWPRLGSDGGWVDMVRGWGVDVTPLAAANVGVGIDGCERVCSRHAGEPLKRIALSAGGVTVRGEAVVTAVGLEGGAVYALSRPLRETLAATGEAMLHVDLRPDMSVAEVAARLARPRGSQSATSWLRKTLRLSPAGISLLFAPGRGRLPEDRAGLARLIKDVPLRVTGLSSLVQAISTAGGVAWPEVTDRLMLKRRPGVFVAGEMLDWEAPTGGYLLQACFATGRAAGQGALSWLGDDGGGP